MLGWLWKFLVGSFDYIKPCEHNWRIHKTVTVYADYGYGVGKNDMAIGDIYHLKCDKCGEMKKTEMMTK